MENQPMTESKTEVTSQEASDSLESIANLGKSLLETQLQIIDAYKEEITLTGFSKALRLALTHEVAPEMVKTELIPRQQFMAAHIAKAIDIVFNLKMTQMGQEIRKEENNEQTNGNV